MSSSQDCIFEIHQQWQSGFSRVYSNCGCNCLFEREILKIGQSSHKMYSNNIVNFQESTTILNACTKKSGNLLKAPPTCVVAFSYYMYFLGIFFLLFILMVILLVFLLLVSVTISSFLYISRVPAV